MKLLWSSRSPFVRKVMIVVLEKGLGERVVRERTVVAPTKPNPDVMALNPLNKLPTLICDDGRPLYDSRVICEYLDGIGGGARLFPEVGDARIEALRLQALGDGILDFLLVGLSERARPEAQRSPELQHALGLKFTTAFDALETEAARFAGAPLGIGHIAIGCACGYADFRYAANDWRAGRPALTRWHEGFAARASYTATEHADVY
jgi:glutathione S-transferase